MNIYLFILTFPFKYTSTYVVYLLTNIIITQIGDVHGCVDEVLDLLRKVQFMPGDLVLFLGDLVGKGPKSKTVIR